MSIDTRISRFLAAAGLLTALFICGCSQTPPVPRHSAPTVTNIDDLRRISVDGRIIAFADTVNWRSELKYVAVLDLPMQSIAAPGKALILGIGGGCVARNYRRAGWNVDVIEPDTARIALARRAFHFHDESIRVMSGNGRDYLADESHRYDIILLDCVSSDDYPTRMLTEEFFRLAASRLGETGIFAVAAESNGWKDDIVQALASTLGSAFRQVTVLPIGEPPNVFSSIVLMASNTVRNDLLRDPERNLDYSPEWRYGPEYQKVHAWDNHFSIPKPSLPVQTDSENSWDRILSSLRAAALKAPKEYFP